MLKDQVRHGAEIGRRPNVKSRNESDFGEESDLGRSLGRRPNVESRNKSEFGGRVRLWKEPFARRLYAPSVKVSINILQLCILLAA